MKVLWFTNTPSLYGQDAHAYHGGGWIESLEQLMSTRQDIQLAIAFFHQHDDQKIKTEAVTYYPIRRRAASRWSPARLIGNWTARLVSLEDYTIEVQQIIEDFGPDVIQVFGSEGAFGELSTLTSIPVVIHLQGLINPYLNTYFPAGYSGIDFLINYGFIVKTLRGSSPFHERRFFVKKAARERSILQNARYVMGRTHWDEMMSRLYNPDVTYFHVDEVLRSEFYASEPAPILEKKVFNVVSTLSPTVYKGIDVLLKTAKQVQQLTSIEIQWKVAGIDPSDRLLRQFEKKEGIGHQEVGIDCLGRQSPDELAQLMLNADVFVHPSYIDNSPNSVCEAQIMGLPVVACDVGGLSTLISHQETGLLVPSNGVFELVHYLERLRQEKALRSRLATSARKAALKRHDKAIIANSLVSAYQDILRIE